MAALVGKRGLLLSIDPAASANQHVLNNNYSARKAQKVAAMSGPQVTGAPPQKKKKKRKRKEKKKRRKTGRFRANPLTTHIHRLQSNRRNHTHLNAGLRLEPSCLSPVNAVQHGRQIDRLWDRDYGVRGLELSAELSMRHKVKVERG